MFAPAELLHAMGLHPLCAEGFSSILSGGKCERGFLDYAAEHGVPETYCSYHRAFIGAVLAGLVPKPRFIVASSSVCDANTNTFRTVAAHYGVNEFYIDIPYEVTEDSVCYVRRQLEDMVRHLEDGMGHRMDKGALMRAVRNTNASVEYQRKFIGELASRDFTNYVAAEMHRILVGHNLLGTDEARTFFRMQYEDIIGSSSGGVERCVGMHAHKRLLWCHVLPYYVEPLKEILDFSDRYTLLMSDLNYDQQVSIDETDILGSMARRLVTNHFNGSVERRVASVTRMAKKLRADGAVIFCHWGCKHSNGGAFLLRNALKAAEVDTLIIDGDACDRRGTNAGQFATRLQAFLEVLNGQSA
jgi:benzoyl-CoA reductase/2-hydroxyglutaryl-CoA dehydratase subunit BcrC/BadD/HgdB